MAEDRITKLRRRTVDAATRFSRAVIFLRHSAENPVNDSERWLAGYEAEQLLWKTLPEALSLVDILNEDGDLEDLAGKAKALTEALRSRRLAGKLERVEGRTAAESRLFLERARELRDRGQE